MQKLEKGVYCQMAICFSCLKGWSQDKKYTNSFCVFILYRMNIHTHTDLYV